VASYSLNLCELLNSVHFHLVNLAIVVSRARQASGLLADIGQGLLSSRIKEVGGGGGYR